MKFTSFLGKDYEFSVELIEGVTALRASWTEEGKLQTIWTPDADRLPRDEAEAQEMLDGLDWNGIG